jgi:cell division protein FtsL
MGMNIRVRHKLHRLIDDLRRDHGRKIVMVLDVALVIAAVLIVMALAEIGAAR